MTAGENYCTKTYWTIKNTLWGFLICMHIIYNTVIRPDKTTRVVFCVHNMHNGNETIKGNCSKIICHV